MLGESTGSMTSLGMLSGVTMMSASGTPKNGVPAAKPSGRSCLVHPESDRPSLEMVHGLKSNRPPSSSAEATSTSLGVHPDISEPVVNVRTYLV